MKFIRKNGRIIPIRSTKAEQNKYEKNMTKVDVASGAAAGALTVGFYKRRKFGMAVAAGLVATSAATTLGRQTVHKTGKAFWEDTKASVLKTGAMFGGGAGAYALLRGAHRLRGYMKAKKAGAAAGKVIIKGLLK